MNKFAKFDEIPLMILKVIKETKYVMDFTDTRADNVKTVYPPTNTVCGGIITEPFPGLSNADSKV